MGSYQAGNFSLGNYVDPTDMGAKHIKQFKDQFYQQMYPANSAFWQQGFIDTRFKVGDQSLNSLIYGGSSYLNARKFFFNLIQRHISMMTGFQRRNRKSTIAMPLHDGDKLADDYTTCLKWCDNRDGFQEYNSQSFEGAITTGINLLTLGIDFTNDPISGDLYTDQIAYCNFLIDTYFRKQDLSDCSAIWIRKWITKNVGKAILPAHAAEIDKIPNLAAKDGRFPLQAELLNLDTNKLMAYDQFFYKTTREATFLFDPYTQDNTEFEIEDDVDNDAELKMIMQKQPWLKMHKKTIPTVKVAISIGDRILYDGPTPLNIDRYPMVPMLCYHEPDLQSYAWKITGKVRCLRDIQWLYNRRKVIELSILESQTTSGWIFPVDSVVDPKAFRQTEEGCLIPLKVGHSASELQRIEAPSIPPSMIELSRALGEDISKVSGINEELLGSATDDKAGILSMLRQGAGLTTLQTIYDKADYTQRLFGELRLQAVRKNFTKSKVTRILGHEPDPLFFSSRSLKYAIAVEEGAFSTTQRQMELQQLLYFRELKIPISNKSILRAAFITNKDKVIEEMEQETKAQQDQQQAIQERQGQLDQAKMMEIYAKTKDTMAAAREKSSRVDEIEANAHYKEKETELGLIREMIALEDMDISQIERSLNMSQLIKLSNKATQPTIGV